MRLYLNDMLYAIAYALDTVEQEYRGIELYHADRVAYIAVQMGRAHGLGNEALLHLAAAAVLHDNAFTEYINTVDVVPSLTHRQVSEDNVVILNRAHCQMGERNVSVLPFYDKIRNAVLYHHEYADGSGAFGKSAEETPFFAKLIQFADELDNSFSLERVDEEQYKAIVAFLDTNTGHLFTEEIVRLFRVAFPAPMRGLLNSARIRQLLQCDLPHTLGEYTEDDVAGIATTFAHIIDYKSHFTCTHSLGIAQKAYILGNYLGENNETCTKLYLAGALHDVGKLTIPTEILEKPDRLTEREFDVMKTHAVASWNILRTIDGIDDVVQWACLHHEKLNGTGYPFGKRATELNQYARILCCTDIYQALIEDRPYKEGISHRDAVNTMRDMVWHGLIDSQVTIAIDACFGRR